MRLKKLVVHGFKSFADRIDFKFDAPITCVVGPNGCGKSNVVDAIKWVLGEQSAKSLRGGAMLDVIFNGADSRKPAAMAEVELVFDNPRRDDGSRALALDTDEVSIARRLWRDGSSEYLVNKQTARLKDIRELFLDTGVGVDAYSIIEQGRVARLLEANPQERRLIFEEAAGISRFKLRKKEAERKLERVEQNLSQLQIVTDEIDKRIRGVRVQAGRARSYQELAARLGELRLMHALNEYRNLRAKLAELSAAREDAAFRLDDATTELSRSESQHGETRARLDALSQSRGRAGHEQVETRSKITQAANQLDYVARQREQIDEQANRLATDRETISNRLAELEREAAAAGETLAELESTLAEQRSQIESVAAEHKAAQLRANEISQLLDEQKRAYLDAMRQMAGIESRLNSIEVERRNAAGQHDRLLSRQGELEAESNAVSSQIQELSGLISSTITEISAIDAEIAGFTRRSTDLGETLAGLTRQLAEAREHRSGLLSRQKLLSDLEARREGVCEAVQDVLRDRESRFPFIRGLVADVMRVDVEHATVIEAALDGRDQWLIADETFAPTGHDAAFGELAGRVNIVSPADIRPNHSPASFEGIDVPVRLAVDLVAIDPADRAIADALLGNTAVVPSLEDADRLRRTGPAGWRYVTLAGEVLEADGTLRVGPLGQSMGILSRRSELDALARQVAESEQQIASLAAELTSGNEQAKSLDAEIASRRQAVYSLNTRKVELAAKKQQADARLAAIGRERPIVDRELAQLQEVDSKLEAEANGLREKRELVSAAQTQANDAVESLTAEAAAVAERVKQTSESLTAARISLGQTEEKLIAQRHAVTRLQSQQNEGRAQVERIAGSLAQLDERRARLATEAEQAAHAKAVAESRLAEIESHIIELDQEIAAADSTLSQLTQALESARTRRAEIESSLHAIEIELSQANVRLESLVQRTNEELSIDLPAKFEEVESRSLPVPANEVVDGEVRESGETTEDIESPQPIDWAAVAEEIRQLKERIQRLGNVNLDAIDELAELEKRQADYAKQLEDLASSRSQLVELIDQISRESAVRFEQTFAAVREHFREMFRKLFGGGRADLVLETELQDKAAYAASGDAAATAPTADGLPVMKRVEAFSALDAGIEVIARPPGKQPVSISQLSGGEKAMTCIALLMSIFKSKPSPFCILDEVDAPLDEANNIRFGQIVQEFLSTSQFIIITHHKRTMQIADQLYGVTMQEHGVSTRVPVRFDQVDAGGRISREAIEAADASEVAAA